MTAFSGTLEFHEVCCPHWMAECSTVFFSPSLLVAFFIDKSCGNRALPAVLCAVRDAMTVPVEGAGLMLYGARMKISLGGAHRSPDRCGSFLPFPPGMYVVRPGSQVRNLGFARRDLTAPSRVRRDPASNEKSELLEKGKRTTTERPGHGVLGFPVPRGCASDCGLPEIFRLWIVVVLVAFL